MSDAQLAEIELKDELNELQEEPTQTSDVAGAAAKPPNAPVVAVCEKCTTPLTGKQGWCRRCGWYPRLQTHVELDAWDREDLPQAPAISKVEMLRRLIPIWAYKLLAGVAVILAASILA